MIMNKTTRRGLIPLLILLAALSAGCTNPFFTDLIEEKPGSYTVTFKSNYDSNDTLDTKTVTEPATTVTDFPANPTRTDYIFAGWNTQQDGLGSAFTSSTTVSANREVYAQWTLISYSYTVTFDKNGGDTEANPAEKTVASPATGVDALPAPPTRSGYDFEGWNTEAEGDGSDFTASTPVSGNMTVYAQWKIISYTVTFKSNYGLNDILYTKKVPYASAVTEFPADPTRTGYTFASWNTEADGDGSAFTSSTPVSGNMEVYAQWTPTGTVINLNLDAGDGTFSQASFTVYKSSGTNSQTVTLTGSGYTNPRWEVDGDLKGTGTSITINAADYGAGGHTLTLFVSKSGITWSKELPFTVELTKE
jgi:uncharacterized repeat protein (TIGR02543 family)